MAVYKLFEMFIITVKSWLNTGSDLLWLEYLQENCHWNVVVYKSGFYYVKS